MIPSYGLARNILEVSVTAICKHCTGITKMHREPLRRTADQFRDEKTSYITKYNSIHLFSCTSLPTIGEAKNVVFKCWGFSQSSVNSTDVSSLSSLPRAPQKTICASAEVTRQKGARRGDNGAWLGEAHHSMCGAMHHFPRAEQFYKLSMVTFGLPPSPWKVQPPPVLPCRTVHTDRSFSSATVLISLPFMGPASVRGFSLELNCSSRVLEQVLAARLHCPPQHRTFSALFLSFVISSLSTCSGLCSIIVLSLPWHFSFWLSSSSRPSWC